MLASKKTKRGVIGAIVLAGVLAVGGYAYTNVIVVNDLSNSGDGTDNVSDLSVDDDTIAWTDDNAGTGADVATQVVFDATAGGSLSNASATGTASILATTVAYVQPVSSGADTTPAGTGGGSTAGAWYSCTTPGGSATATFTCDTTTGGTPLKFVDIDQFRVVVHD